MLEWPSNTGARRCKPTGCTRILHPKRSVRIVANARPKAPRRPQPFKPRCRQGVWMEDLRGRSVKACEVVLDMV